jgi:hypothetical protein
MGVTLAADHQRRPLSFACGPTLLSAIPIRSLRWILKLLSRQFGFRCIAIEQEHERKA